MAFEVPGFAYSARANADLTAAQHKFVTINTSGKVATVAAAGVAHHGILQNDPDTDEMATVMFDGISKVVAGGTVAVGDELSIDSSGRAVAVASGVSVGKCLLAAAVGELSTLLLYPTPRRTDPLFLGTVNVETLAGNKTLTVADATFQRLDPAGARDVILPAEAISKGKAFYISNAANAAEAITVEDDAAATVGTLNQDEAAWFVCDGTAWAHMGIETIAQT